MLQWSVHSVNGRICRSWREWLILLWKYSAMILLEREREWSKVYKSTFHCNPICIKADVSPFFIPLDPLCHVVQSFWEYVTFIFLLLISILVLHWSPSAHHLTLIFHYKVHTISFQTFFIWALLLIVHSWNSSPLRSNLLQPQCTCCTIPTTSGRPHRSPLVWACQWPSSQPLSSPQLSHNDSLWA